MNNNQLMNVALILAGVGLLYVLMMRNKNEAFASPEVANLNQDVENETAKAVTPQAELPDQGELKPIDLLPEDSRDEEFAKMHPLSEGLLENKNFLEAGHHIGALSEPLRNSNLSLRALPSIERVQLSPWNISTKGDESRKGFELGQ